MIYIDFMGGLHGNFLCYAINSLDTSVRDSLPFTSFGTSHKEYNKHLSRASHYTVFKQPLPGNDVISVIADIDDCLLVNLLCYGRAGDYGFDLKNFEVNFYEQLKNTRFSDAIDHIDASYGTDIKNTNSLPRGILREYFKFNFKNYEENNVIKEIKKQKYDHPVLEINFKDLYNFNQFFNTIQEIIRYFNLPYVPDEKWYKFIWQQFIEKNEAIEQNNYAHYILDCVVNKRTERIDFNLLQESWLSARVEMLYNVEMPFEQEQYFQNTEDIVKYIDISKL